MLDILYKAGRGVDRNVLVITRPDLFSSELTLCAWHGLAHTRTQYSEVEQYKLIAVCLRVSGSVPQLLLTSLLRKLFLDASFSLSLTICSLKERVLSLQCDTQVDWIEVVFQFTISPLDDELPVGQTVFTVKCTNLCFAWVCIQVPLLKYVERVFKAVESLSSIIL